MSSAPPKIPVYYTPGQITLASFLGSPMAAGWLMSRTYRGAGEKKKERLSLVLSALITAALFGIGFALPEKTPKSGLSSIVTISVFYTAKHLLGPVIQSRISSGAPKGSWWMAAGVGVLFLIAIFAVIFGFVLLLPVE